MKIFKNLLWMCLALFGSGFASERMVVAVTDFEPQGVVAGDVNILIDRLRSELVNTQVFRVMERKQMSVILEEQGFLQSGACDASQCQVEMGRLLGVDYMIVGVVGMLGGSYTVSARVLDVETGEILYTVNEDFRGEIIDVLSQVIPRVAARLSRPSGAPQVSLKAEPGVGDLVVDADYQGSKVFLDGVELPQKTPVTLRNISAGSHQVSTRHESNYGSLQIELLPGELKRIKIAMPVGRGSIKVFANVPEGQVSVDGILVCEAPCILENQLEGSRQVRVSRKGYQAWEGSVEVKVDSTVIAEASLVRLSYLRLEVNPDNASVTVNGVPVIAYLDPLRGMLGFFDGDYAIIRAEAPGYETRIDSIPLDTLHPTHHQINLQFVKSRISIQGKPAGAELTLNGKAIGALPLMGKILDPGAYRAVVSKPGFLDWEEQLDLQKGDWLSRSIRLQPTQARLDSLRKASRRDVIRYGSMGLSGLASAVAMGFGLYFNSKLDYHSQHLEYENWGYLETAPSAPGDEPSRSGIDREWEKVKTYRNFRNVMYGLAGLGLGASFVVYKF
jgi:TolB-like protein